MRGLLADLIDIVKDPVPPNEYKTEEDPKLFHSTKTQRGPLSDNWIEEHKQQAFPIMCAYKLCKVEFRYWGMQSKIERFIHDTGELGWPPPCLHPHLPLSAVACDYVSVLLLKADPIAHAQLPAWFILTTHEHCTSTTDKRALSS